MLPQCAVLNSSHWGDLNFSRCTRTHNAIIFVIEVQVVEVVSNSWNCKNCWECSGSRSKPESEMAEVNEFEIN